MKQCIKMNCNDNVATVLERVLPGETIAVFDRAKNELGTVTADSEIPFAHKICMTPISKGEVVYKFGIVIGRAIADIRVGEHVHVHNVISIKGAEEVRKGAHKA